MQMDIQMKLKQDQKMYGYLRDNSQWYKELNRNPQNYKKFIDAMKEKYKIRTTDKLNGFMDNISMVNSVLEVFK